MELPENLTLCRATIHLAGGVRAGDLVTVDVNDPDMEVYLRKGYLIPTAPEEEQVVESQPQVVESHTEVEAGDEPEPAVVTDPVFDADTA